MGRILKTLIGSATLLSGGAVFYAFYQKSKYDNFMANWQNNPQKKLQLFKTQNSLLFDFDDVSDKFEEKHHIKALRKELLKEAEGLVLETCVGTSRNIRYYPQNTKILGIDWNQNYLDYALRKPEPKNIQIEYKVEDTERMTLKSNLFDTVVDTFGLNYTLHPQKCLQEMKRVCKPGGKIILMETGTTLSEYENHWLDFQLPRYIYEYGYFNNRDWTKIVEDSGLKIVKQERHMNDSLHLFILENNKDKKM